jgi:hypothetical protein
MNKRVVAVLVALVLILGGAALFVRQREDAARPAASAQLGQPLLKDLKASAIASIAIREAKGTLTLVKKDRAWTIAERKDFPADFDKVADLVLKSIELKVGQAEPIGDKDRERLNLIDPGKAGQASGGSGTSVAFKTSDGRVLAELLLGKQYFRNEPEGDPAKAIGDGRFVMLPANDGQVFIVSEPYRMASTASADWIAKDGIAIDRVKSLEYTPAQGEGYRIERAAEGAEWKLDRLPAGARLDSNKADAAARSLDRIELEDVAANDTGPDNPSLVRVSTFDAMNYTLKIGQLDKDRYPVSLETEGTPKREFEPRKDEPPEAKVAREKSFAESTKRMEESVARNRALRGHVLLVAKARLADLLRKKGEFLETKKPEPAKPEAKKAGPKKT